jgi:hypothetical protein
LLAIPPENARMQLGISLKLEEKHRLANKAKPIIIQIRRCPPTKRKTPIINRFPRQQKKAAEKSTIKIR